VRWRGRAVDIAGRPGVETGVTAAGLRHGVGRGALLRCLLAAALALAIAPVGTAQGRHQIYTPSISDYGGVGLLQTRNARFGDEGLFTVGVSVVNPYHRYFFSVHGLKGVEAGFRYTTIQNRDILRFDEDIRNTAFQDKGADLKLLLLDETRWRPAVAIGLQDVIGTAQFAGEYIVASKRYYDFDFSVGMGWGRLGDRGHFKNPLSLLSSSFKSRLRRRGGEGGTVDLGQFFAGERVALFGGIEWLTPLEGLRLKIEYDPNSYQNEPLDNRFRVDAPINVGLAYQPFSWLDVGIGFERGNTLQLRVAMTPNLIDPKPVLRIDTPPPPVAPRELPRPPARTPSAGAPATTARQAADRLFDGLAEIGVTFESLDIDGPEVTLRVSGEAAIDRAAAARIAMRALPPPVDAVTVAVTLPDGTGDATRYPNGTFELAQALGVAPDALIAAEGAPWTEAQRRTAAAAITARIEQDGFAVDAVDVEETAAVVFVTQDKYRALPQAIGRVARAVASVAPPSVEEITVVNLVSGLETARVTLLRTDIERALALHGSPEETLAHTILAAGDGEVPPDAYINPDRYPDFSWSLTPQLRQHVGGTDAFYLFQIWARLGASVQLTRHFGIHGAIGKNLYNNFDRIRNFGRSRLERVRSLVEHYLQEGDDNLVNLYANYSTNLGRDWYGRLTAGILEEMYGGVQGELLYRPFDSRLAVGLDVSHVFQRDFEQRIDFRKFDTTTGHISFYYDTPYRGLFATLRIGRYLARDIGATLELAREFPGGIVLGAFATLTNVSAEDFGEGSFDKGFFLSIPLDLFFLKPTTQRANFLFRPLTRDGGQRVSQPQSLYGATSGARLGPIVETWSVLYH
jgi:hypothetical protein